MRKLVVIVVLFSFGCGASQAPQVRPIVAEDRRPEARALPIDVREEPLPEGTPVTPGEDYVVPVTAGECEGATEPCPAEDGIQVSEARANRDALYRIRYRELRDTYDADRMVWSAHRELYEAQVAADREEIARLQPSWWELHDAEIMTAVGLVVGAALTVAITFAVNQASE